jgi:hypothetical protein
LQRLGGVGGALAAHADRVLADLSAPDLKVARGKLAWTSALSKLVQAGVYAQRGKTEQAICALEAAVTELDAAEMKLYAAAARRRLGALMGGDAGAGHIAAGDAFMDRQKVTDNARITAVLAPGFVD